MEVGRISFKSWITYKRPHRKSFLVKYVASNGKKFTIEETSNMSSWNDGSPDDAETKRISTAITEAIKTIEYDIVLTPVKAGV